jgi:hypothetical protein
MAQTRPKPWEFAKTTYILVVACWVLYATLTLLAPTTAGAVYKLNFFQLSLLRLTFILPVHLIWLLAAVGATTLKQYAVMIREGREAAAINLIASGLLWTLAYLVTNSVLSAIVPFYINSAGYDALIVFRDHLAPLMSVVAFWMIFAGSQQLKSVVHFDTWGGPTMWIISAFGLVSFLLVLEFAMAPTVAQSQADLSSMSLVNHTVLIYTMILPYIIAWFLGVLACINIAKYSQKVGGVIYRQALRDMVIGIWLVIILAVSIQLLTFASKFVLGLAIMPLLVIVYLLLFIYGAGFMYIRSGARKLISIEAQT